MERWAEQLKELRLSLKLSRQALAALAGVSPQTIKAYELGLRSPSQANLTAILDALRADRYLRNDILIGAGFAPDGGRLGPANDDYMFTLEEAREAIMGRPWPAHVNNELMEVLAANELMQRVWDVDLDREYNTPVERNMLTVAATPRFADRILNWKEMVSVGIAVMKGHHRGPERTPEGTSQYFQAVIQRLFEGAPHYLAAFLQLWESVPPRTPKIRWSYPVAWDHLRAGKLRFTVLVSAASEQDGLHFHDWVPEDAATAAGLELLKAEVGASS